MPRNITVTFADGQTHTYQNAPDDITPEQVTQRAQQEFGQSVTALDGGRAPARTPQRQAAPAAAPSPPRPSTPEEPRTQGTLSSRGYSIPQFGRDSRGGGAATPIPERIRALSRSEAQSRLQRGENRLREITANMDGRTRRLAYEKFYARPTVRAYRQQAGLSEVRTREEEIRTTARRTADRNTRNVTRAVRGIQSLVPESIPEPIRNFIAPVTALDAEDTGEFLTAANAGIRRGLFGIPERLSAAGAAYLPSALTGNDTDASYDNILQTQRAITDAELDQSLAGNLTGQGGTAILGGAAAVNALRQGGARLAASQSPNIARAGNVLQSAARLEPGRRLGNVARVSAGGATLGAAQAAGEGSDVGTGALVGAVAPVALGAAGKAAAALGRAGRTLTRPLSSNVNRAIRELVTESPDALRARQADLTRRTGSNVSVIAALRDQDFNQVVSRVLTRSEDALEVARTHTSDYMQNFMNRMTGHVNQAGRTANAQQASIGDLAELRKNTADDLMQPIADIKVNLNDLPLDDLERQLTREIGSRDRALSSRIREALQDIDPEDSASGLSGQDIAAARKVLDDWGLGGAPVQATVREMDALRRSLDAAAKSTRTSQPANSLAYRNAARVIRDFVEEEVPPYGQMVDTYAAQSRMMEGFETAAAGRRVGETADDQLRGALQTPEGKLGMQAGELFRLREAAGNRTSGAVGLARDLASGGRLTRPASAEADAALPGTVTENLGDQASRGLREAAEGEYSVLERMLRAGKIDVSKLEPGALDNPGTIAYGATLLGGNAQAQTIARFVANLASRVGNINNRTASNITDLLFSNDPAKTSQALRALERAGLGERAVAGMMRNALPKSSAIGQLAGGATVDDAAPEPVPGPSPDQETPVAPVNEDFDIGETFDEEPLEQGFANPGGYVPDQGVPNPNSEYADQLSQVYSAETPQFQALIERQFQQESGNRQLDDNGRPITSSAGAIGIAQVMPGTAPEAARMAGVPFDEQAYRSDASYNKLIGMAYMSNMLRRYDGDVAKALAAYNAGPGRVDRALRNSPQNWLQSLPEETKDYVRKLA